MDKTKSSSSWVARPIRTTSGGSTTQVGDTLILNRSRTGNELPNHADLIRRKIEATTALTAFDEIVTADTRGYFEGVDTAFNFPIYSNRMGFQYNSFKPVKNMVPSNQMNLAVASATSKAYDIIRKKQSPFSAQVFAGEFRQTLDFLKHPLEKSVNLTYALINSRRKILKGQVFVQRGKRPPYLVTQALGNSWLEYRFGILPLISDMKELLGVAAALAARNDQLTYRCYGRSDSASTVVNGVQPDMLGFTYQSEQTTKLTAECIIHFGIMFKLLDKAASVQQVVLDDLCNLSEVPNTLWELTPMSFLVDYFVNVGDIIKAATTSVSELSHVSKSVVLTAEKTISISNVRPQSSRYVITKQKPSIFAVKRRDVTRTAGTLGIPPLSFSIPGSNIRLANMAALLTSYLPTSSKRKT